MTIGTDLLNAAIAGYHDRPNPHLWSSPMWLAHQAGRAIGDAGYSEPVYPVKTSRGFSMRLNTRQGEVIVTFRGDALDLFEVSEPAKKGGLL
jgi:hypothetical protein